MPEVITKYKNAKTLSALKDFAKYFDFVLEKPRQKRVAKQNTLKSSNLPITFAEKPDVAALAGIWKDKDISLDELRKRAWGGRL